MEWNGNTWLLSSVSKRRGPVRLPYCFHLLNYFFRFYYSLFRQIKKKKKRVAHHGIFFPSSEVLQEFLGGFKASDRQEQGHIIPIQMITLAFLVTLERWKWFDMETRLTCSIFAMLSGGLTRTLGSCFDKGIGRFHFPSVVLVSLLAPPTQQNSETLTSKFQLPCITSITSSVKPSWILCHPPSLKK